MKNYKGVQAPNYLKTKTINLMENELNNETKKSRNFTKSLAMAMSLVLVFGSTVYAVQHFLSAKDVAEELHYSVLAESFESEDAIVINDVKTDGEYTVSLLGITNSTALENFDEIEPNSSYMVVAIHKNKGEITVNEEFFISPLIKGRNPMEYSILTMSGGFSSKVIDGVYYRIISCDNIEIFAHEGIQLCVTDGSFYNKLTLNMDSKTGKFTSNEEYKGLNLVFDVPIDTELGNPDLVAQYIADKKDKSEDTELSTEDERQEINNQFNIIDTEVQKLINLKFLQDNAVLNQSSLQTVDKTDQTINVEINGMMTEYQMPFLGNECIVDGDSKIYWCSTSFSSNQQGDIWGTSNYMVAKENKDNAEKLDVEMYELEINYINGELVFNF